MISKRQQYKKLIHMYDQKRLSATKEQASRQKEIYKKIPRIKELDYKMSNTGLKLARAATNLLDNPKELITEFEDDNKQLQNEKEKLLTNLGYPKDYLEIKYECSKCQDTGYIESEHCSCFKQSLINIAYEQSNIKHILEYENFDTFDFSYYSKEVSEKHGRSPHANMQTLYQFCVHYVDKFDNTFQNILFHGDTGLGKTFLCNCIAKDLLDIGHTVLYLPAVQLFQLFEAARFHRDEMEEQSKEMLNTLLSVELLIIDDLGTEFVTSFTGPELFNTLNTRILNQMPTIISTNLSPEELRNHYSDRIISRVFGNYEVLPVFGEDIRLLKKYKK